MNPNPTGYPAFQQPANPMFSSAAAYAPVPTQSPQNPQVPFYPNAPFAPYPQAKAPQGHVMQQQPQQHAFGAVPLQTAAPAMMPSGVPQQGKSSLSLSPTAPPSPPGPSPSGALPGLPDPLLFPPSPRETQTGLVWHQPAPNRAAVADLYHFVACPCPGGGLCPSCAVWGRRLTMSASLLRRRTPPQ